MTIRLPHYNPAHNNMIKRLNNSGQTLLEVIVALGVVLSVLITIAGLVMINVFGQKASESRIIAGNLAREGIEAMRNIRDTVKLQKTSLQDYIQDNDYIPTAHYYLPSIDVTNNHWTLNSPSCTTFCANNYLYLLNNLYRYATGGTLTPFRRYLIIDPICQNTAECATGDTGACELADGAGVCTATIGYRVTSEVQWTENNQVVPVFKLVDFLYEW